MTLKAVEKNAGKVVNRESSWESCKWKQESKEETYLEENHYQKTIPWYNWGPDHQDQEKNKPDSSTCDAIHDSYNAWPTPSATSSRDMIEMIDDSLDAGGSRRKVVEKEKAGAPVKSVDISELLLSMTVIWKEDQSIVWPKGGSTNCISLSPLSHNVNTNLWSHHIILLKPHHAPQDETAAPPYQWLGI